VEVLPKPPSAKGPAEVFTGDVYFDVIAKGYVTARTDSAGVATLPVSARQAGTVKVRGRPVTRSPRPRRDWT
jgi:hypothetical protein